MPDYASICAFISFLQNGSQQFPTMLHQDSSFHKAIFPVLLLSERIKTATVALCQVCGPGHEGSDLFGHVSKALYEDFLQNFTFIYTGPKSGVRPEAESEVSKETSD